MLNSVTLFLILLWSVAKGEKTFNITKYKFCEMLCPFGKTGYHQSDACQCKQEDDTFTVLKSEPEFRETVLDVLNTYRNKFAMGEYSEKFGSASDMTVLNYDLELEYLCYCKLRTSADSITGCFRSKYQYSAHYIRIAKHDTQWKELNITKLEDARQYLIEVLEDSLSRFEYNNPSSVVSVVMIRKIVYSKMVTIGCARVVAPKVKQKHLKQFVGCILSPDVTLSPNDDWWETRDDYIKGQACSNCAWKYPKCDTEKYPGLCGTLKPLPTEALPDPDTLNETLNETLTEAPANETTGSGTTHKGVLCLSAACFACLLLF